MICTTQNRDKDKKDDQFLK